MCWVQRKAEIPGLEGDRPANPFQRQISERISHYERVMKEAEDELALVHKALSMRQEAMAALGDGDSVDNNDEEEQEEEVKEEEKEEEPQEEEDDDPDYLKNTKRYLAKRPAADDFQAQTQAANEALKAAMKAGFSLHVITKAKKGAFGRTKKAKRERCFMVLSADGTKLSWGKDKKKPKETVQLGSIDAVLMGYKSETFEKMKEQVTGREPEWACFTLETPGKQFDFVVEDDIANVCMATMLKPNKQPTPAQWRWRRTLMRFKEQQGGMMDAINKLARQDSVESSSVSGSDAEGQ